MNLLLYFRCLIWVMLFWVTAIQDVYTQDVLHREHIPFRLISPGTESS